MTKQIDRDKLLARLRNGLSMGNPDMSIQLLIDHIESGDFDTSEAAGWVNAIQEYPNKNEDVLCIGRDKFFIGFYNHYGKEWFSLDDLCRAKEVLFWYRIPPIPEKDDEKPAKGSE